MRTRGVSWPVSHLTGMAVACRVRASLRRYWLAAASNHHAVAYWGCACLPALR
uniref:Uncharacterized protein n=1 Tax=Oryza sativa subsp. japonica TaxID=39947 RepID=Q6ZAK4_ORYSJ|nr:hypothetical protein [Oryza sativa Japonica Group]